MERLGSDHYQVKLAVDDGTSANEGMFIFVMSTKINNKSRQLVSIDRKVCSVTEITVCFNLHLCLSVFISFPIMFYAQSIRSTLISSAPIDSAF
jgi:hypothetical protein